jgi:glycosyltransferase involved in cell wall biosynthesis
MKVLFIGHFSNSESIQPGASIAGDEVQRKIIRSLREIEDVDVLSISQRPARTWPRGNLIFPSSKDNYSFFPWFLNIAFVRDFLFGFYCFLYLFGNKPDKVVQYNSYLFVNIFVIAASFFLRFKNIVIVQDYRVGGNFKTWARVHDKIAGFLIRFYHVVVPVTDALAKELKVESYKCKIFPGAMEHDSPFVESDKKKHNSNEGEIKVLYAGALERHNGIDRLIDVWAGVPNNFKLLIYGKGSLEKNVLDSVKKHSNIQYLGLASKEEVHQVMLKSDFNICFRFSEGLDERFFFPSKFFSVNCYPGFALVNDFYGLPDGFRKIGLLVSDDLSNIFEIMNLDKKIIEIKVNERLSYLYNNFIWSVLLSGVVNNE